MALVDQLSDCRVIPVVTVHDVESTLRMSRALQSGGMKAVEITLRTPRALECMEAVKSEMPDMLVAAGTVTNTSELEQVQRAGADCCVSPGISSSLLAAARSNEMPLLPGVATASELMLGLNEGIEAFKLFPAVAVGGLQLLKSFYGPFPQARFCPTGGLTPDNFREFLALPNVICCGGSWMVSDQLVSNGEWDTIEQLAREAMELSE